MDTRPTFENPPLVEFVLGIQFSPLTELTSAHFGLFWSKLKEQSDEWVVARDAPLISDQFELFTAPLWKTHSRSAIRLDMGGQPGRCLIENKSRDRMIQLQATRFHLNWRKSAGQTPCYKNLISEFLSMLDAFCTFCKDSEIGEVIPNQWEITFVNSFPVDDYWSSPEDWDRVLPGLFGNRFESKPLHLRMEKRHVEWSFEIEPAIGRLHVKAQSGKWAWDPKDTLLLDLTCRGPIVDGSLESVRGGLDVGYGIAADTFLSITPNELQKRWSPKT